MSAIVDARASREPPEAEAAPVGFRLSPQQLHLWRAQEEDGAASFTGTAEIELEGLVDGERLRRALAALIARHEILRTRFQRFPGLAQPVQSVASEASFDWYRQELEVCPPETLPGILTGIEQQLMHSPFDLEQGPALRASWSSLGERRHRLVIILPALCADGRSLKILFAELAALYGGDNLPAGPMQYADFAEWQHEMLEAVEAEAERARWRAGMRLYGPQLLPFGVGNGAIQGFVPSFCRLPLTSELRGALVATAAELALTAADLALAVWQILLARLTATERLVLGVTADGRPYEELEEGLGLYARSLPTLTDSDAGRPFADVAVTTAAAVAEAREWQEFFAPETAGFTAARGRPAPFFELAFEHLALSPPLLTGGLCWHLARARTIHDRFRLKLFASGDGDHFELALACDPRHFSSEDARRLGSLYANLLTDAIAHPQTPAGKLRLLDDRRGREILTRESRRVRLPGQAACLHQLFEAQVDRAPQRIAVVDGSRSLTYHELDARTNRLAHRLRELGVDRESRVALCTGRCLEQVVAVLAILKVGAAYVPLHPELPGERISLLLADSRPTRVLVEKRFRHLVPAGAEAITLEIAASSAGEEPRLRLPADPDQLAYLLYTSGSTGRPKGVLVPHSGVSRRLTWIQDQFPLTAADAVLLKAPLSFDVSVRELFWPLLAGARLVVAPEDLESDTVALARRIDEERITVLHFVPSLLRLMLAAGGERPLGRLRRLIVGGEGFRQELAKELRQRVGAETHNSYGPTEVSIHAAFYTLGEGGAIPGETVPIGAAIAETSLHLLDRCLAPVPDGAPGELFVAGAGVVRGYCSAPGATAAAFLPNPHADIPGERLYRTADLARRLPGGELQWLGRSDSQVKVHGVRIELGEIEAVLEAHPHVREAAVRETIREGKAGAAFVAYLVADGSLPEIEELRDWLARRLPPIMLPAAFLNLDELPRTASGKIDRHELPDPESVPTRLRREYIAPRGPVEEALASIWAEALGIERPGVYDNFFELGGNSVLATQLAARMRRAFQVDVPLRELFNRATVAELAKLLISYEKESGRTAKIARVILRMKSMAAVEREAAPGNSEGEAK